MFCRHRDANSGCLLVIFVSATLLPEVMSLVDVDISMFNCQPCQGRIYCFSRFKAKFEDIACDKIGMEQSSVVRRDGKQTSTVLQQCAVQLPGVCDTSAYWIKRSNMSTNCDGHQIHNMTDHYEVHMICYGGSYPYICDKAVGRGWTEVNGRLFMRTDTRQIKCDAVKDCYQHGGELANVRHVNMTELELALPTVYMPMTLWVNNTGRSCNQPPLEAVRLDGGTVSNYTTTNIELWFGLCESKFTVGMINASCMTNTVKKTSALAPVSTVTTIALLSTSKTMPSQTSTVSTTKTSVTSTVTATKTPKTSTVSTTKPSQLSTVTTTSSQTSTLTTKPPQTSTVTTTKPPQTSTVSTTKPPQSSTVATTKPPQTSTLATTKPPHTSTVTMSKTSTLATTKSSQTSTVAMTKPLQTSTQATTKPPHTSTQATTKPPQTSTVITTKPPQTSTQATTRQTQTSTQATTRPHLTSTVIQQPQVLEMTHSSDWTTYNQREFYVNKNKSSFIRATDVCRIQLNSSMAFFTDALQYLEMSETIKLTVGHFWIGVVVNDLHDKCLQLRVGQDNYAYLSRADCLQLAASICSRTSNVSDVLENPEFSRLLEDMKIDSSETQKSRRKLVSVFDGRTSATAVGSIGVIAFVSVFTLIALLDLTRLKFKCRYNDSKWEKVKVIRRRKQSQIRLSVSDSTC